MRLSKIIVATGNKGKLREIKQIFKNVEIISMDEAGFSGEIEETGASFKENALIKAKAVSSALNAPVIADDSGLCVDALHGAPGIYSARFSGEGEAANRKLLLKRLNDITDRAAHFECAVCLYYPNGKTVFGEGRTFGRILQEEIGEAGFGYYRIFYSDDLNKSFGLASEEEKNSVSHRYRALCDLLNKL